jgi:hypothetical protein
MREIRLSGSVRGVQSNLYPYRDRWLMCHSEPLLSGEESALLRYLPFFFVGCFLYLVFLPLEILGRIF